MWEIWNRTGLLKYLQLKQVYVKFFAVAAFLRAFVLFVNHLDLRIFMRKVVRIFRACVQVVANVLYAIVFQLFRNVIIDEVLAGLQLSLDALLHIVVLLLLLLSLLVSLMRLSVALVHVQQGADFLDICVLNVWVVLSHRLRLQIMRFCLRIGLKNVATVRDMLKINNGLLSQFSLFIDVCALN